uniref:Uncharacterized protein n=1 Tax=Arundo donax TaxID=35708 RepID=A0A0A9EP21_ARUDO
MENDGMRREGGERNGAVNAMRSAAASGWVTCTHRKMLPKACQIQVSPLECVGSSAS